MHLAELFSVFLLDLDFKITSVPFEIWLKSNAKCTGKHLYTVIYIQTCMH